jgi:PAS domain S-box-containing protein
MNAKPTYENLEQKVRDLETSIQQYKSDGHITDHSASIHNSSYLLTALMNHRKDSILISDEKGKPLIFNAAYAKLMKEVLNLDMKPGIQPHKLRDDPEAKKYWDQLHTRALRGDRFQEEYTHEITKDDIRTFEVSFNPIMENDQITGFIELTRDITERKQAEEVLQKSEIKHKTLIKNIPGMVYCGYPDWSAEIVSGSEMISGYTTVELNSKEKNWLSIVHPDDVERVFNVGSEFIRRSKEIVQTYRIITKSGKIRWVEDRKTSRVSKENEFIGLDGIVFDITERKKAEAELRLKNMVFETAITANSTADNKGIFTHVNNAFIKTWGYEKKEEAVGKPISEFLKFEDEAKKIIIALNETGKWQGEYTALKKDGTTFVAYELATIIKDESGNIIGYQSSVLDISEQKRAEEGLRKSEEKYRSIFENAVEGFFQSTPEGRFTSVNPAFASMLGYASPEELISSISDIAEQYYVNTEDRLRYKQLLEKDGSVEHFEFKARCKDGSRIWVSNSTRAIYDRNGKIARYEGNVNDITPRKRAEDALRDSEAKYRSMMEAMKDPVYICSPDFRVEYMNPAMVKRIGRDATGEYCFKALHDLGEKCPWCIHNMIQQDESSESDIISPKDNRSYHVSHSPIVHEDGSISKMTVYRDTTDFKKMETQLRQAQKMEAIGTLAGGIAHDFNNILFPMFGYLEMMLEDVPEGNPLRGYLAEIFSGAKRARDLVKQILTFSRQKDHEMKPLKVHLVIKEALKLIKSSLPSTIKIIQNIQNDCGLVFADPTQIHQIVMNLCTNAYHAMEEKGGKLTVNLKEVELTAVELKASAMVPGPYVYLTVTDTGPGMEQIVIDRIFDPYFSTKEKGKGTGLGLAVVDGIVKSHGGHISVYSEPGKGTEFKVYLPVIKHQETTQRVETDLPIKKGDERILLVDDQELIVDMERQMLERLGYQVTARISSTDALEAFRAQPGNFDLVITDLTMPNMTGDKLAGALIKIRSDIPVILCTGFSEIMTKEKAADLGIKGFLMKPVLMIELSNVIRKVLDDK